MIFLKCYFIICLIFLIIFEVLNIKMRKIVIRNGWKVSEGKGIIYSFLLRCILYFIPLINLCLIYVKIYYVITTKEKHEQKIYRLQRELSYKRKHRSF